MDIHPVELARSREKPKAGCSARVSVAVASSSVFDRIWSTICLNTSKSYYMRGAIQPLAQLSCTRGLPPCTAALNSTQVPFMEEGFVVGGKSLLRSVDPFNLPVDKT